MLQLCSYLASLLMSKLVAIIGIDLGFMDPFRKLAVFPPLYRSMIRSLTSTDVLRDVCFGGSSIAKGRVEIHALSRKKAFDPFT